MDADHQPGVPQRGRRRRRPVPLHAHGLSGPLRRRAGDRVSPAPGTRWCGEVVTDPRLRGDATRSQVPDSIKFRRGEGIWFDSGFVYLVTTTDETVHVYDTNAATLGIVYKAADVAGHPAARDRQHPGHRSGDLMVAEDSYTNDPDAMDVCLITQNHEVSRFLKITGNDHFIPNPVRGRLDRDEPGRHADVRRLAALQGHGPVVRDPRPVPPGSGHDLPGHPGAHAHPGGRRRLRPQRGRRRRHAHRRRPPPKPTPGVPIGLEVTKRMAEKTFIRNGLALGFTLDKAASVRVRVTRQGRQPHEDARDGHAQRASRVVRCGGSRRPRAVPSSSGPVARTSRRRSRSASRRRAPPSARSSRTVTLRQ